MDSAKLRVVNCTKLKSELWSNPRSKTRPTYQEVLDLGCDEFDILELLKPDLSICIISWRWGAAPNSSREEISDQVFAVLEYFVDISGYDFMLMDIFSLPQIFYAHYSGPPTMKLLTMFARLYLVIPVLYGRHVGAGTINDHFNRAWLVTEMVHSFQGDPLKNISSFNGNTLTYQELFASLDRIAPRSGGTNTLAQVLTNFLSQILNPTRAERLVPELMNNRSVCDFSVIASRLVTQVDQNRAFYDPQASETDNLAGVSAFCISLCRSNALWYWLERTCSLCTTVVGVSQREDLGRIMIMLYSLFGPEASHIHDLVDLVDTKNIGGRACEILVLFCLADHIPLPGGFTVTTNKTLERFISFRALSRSILNVVRPRGFNSVVESQSQLQSLFTIMCGKIGLMFAFTPNSGTLCFQMIKPAGTVFKIGDMVEIAVTITDAYNKLCE